MRKRAFASLPPRDPMTRTPAFQDWFGDSKVVDGWGGPTVVYHGTPDVRGLFGVGGEPGFRKSVRGEVYFATDDYWTADTYADPRRAWDFQGAEPGVIPLYLRIESPMEVNARGARWQGTEHYIQMAKDAGHDGLIIHNSVDPYSVLELKSKPKPATVYVFFSPAQAKSALTAAMRSRVDGSLLEYTGPNSGAYSRSTGDLRNPNPNSRR